MSKQFFFEFHNPRTKTALLTIQFVFHPPRNPFAPSSQPPEQPTILLTHRNKLDQSILVCIQNRLMERNKSKKDSFPSWLMDLTIPSSDDPELFIKPTCVMPTRVDPLASLQARNHILQPGHIVREGFYKLDPDKPLEMVLKNKVFVEFPTIEVWEDGAFTGIIVDDRGAVLLDDEEERKPKRRKMGVREGKKAISGLLGGYGSGDDEDTETEEKNVLNTLAGYDDSEDDGEEVKAESVSSGRRPVKDWLKEEDLVDEDAEGETDEEFEENAENLVGILEKLRQAGALQDPGENRLMEGQEEDDQVDWGDSDNET